MDRPRYRGLASERLPVPLRGLVECAWRAEVPHGAATSDQRVLPDGCMDLLLLDGRVLVVGPDTAAHRARSAPGSVTTGLRFRPGALPALLRVAADSVRDRRVDLADVLSPGVPATFGNHAEMHLTVAGTFVHDAPMHLDGGGLAALLATTVALVAAAERDRHPLPTPLPNAASRALAGGLPAAELAAWLGLTTRTLHRHCVATLGYGPSVARRVLRFHTAAGLLHARTALPRPRPGRATPTSQPEPRGPRSGRSLPHRPRSAPLTTRTETWCSSAAGPAVR